MPNFILFLYKKVNKMEHILINSQTTQIDNILNTIDKLSIKEFDTLFLQIKKKRIKNFSIVNSKQESELLLLINKDLPLKNRKRYTILLTKRQNETLTNEEYEELLELTEKKEGLQEERLKNMIALSKIRDITLSKLVEQLELKPDLYAV